MATQATSYRWLWWLAIPVIIIGAMVAYLANKPGELFPAPRVLDANAQGQLLELPMVSANREVEWKKDWISATEPAELAVARLLQQLHDQTTDTVVLTVLTDPDSPERKQLAERLGKVLQQNNLGRVQFTQLLPQEQHKQGVVLNSNLDDNPLAKKLMGALTPYIGGKVALLYKDDLPANQLELYLYGTPFFNQQGQATFDPALYGEDNENK